MADQGVRAAARSVRWFLPELVGPAAGEVDAEIAGLICTPHQACPLVGFLWGSRRALTAWKMRHEIALRAEGIRQGPRPRKWCMG
jgi:hypothetical protein